MFLQLDFRWTSDGDEADGEENYELQFYIKNGKNALLPTTQIILSYSKFSDNLPLGDYLESVYIARGELYGTENFWTERTGTIYNYSNVCISFTAYLVEVKTGQSYADFVQENIFDPLGMKSSSFDQSSLDQGNLPLYSASIFFFTLPIIDLKYASCSCSFLITSLSIF